MSGTKLGEKFGRPDIERVGLFSEAPYLSLKYQQNKISTRGSAFLAGGRKTRCGTMDGYFDNQFKRIGEGEGITRGKKINPNQGLAPFITNAIGKKHSTPGDCYGTFTKKVEAFSCKTKPQPPTVHEPHNFLTNNVKEGGPGYADICLDKYPKHLPDGYGLKAKEKQYGALLNGPMYNCIRRQEYFDENPLMESPPPQKGLYLKRPSNERPLYAGPLIPNGPGKLPGGSHAGCFNPFPSFMPCKYVSTTEALQVKADKKIEIPQRPPGEGNKTFFTFSVMQHYTDVKLNATNHKSYVPVYCKHLIKSEF